MSIRFRRVGRNHSATRNAGFVAVVALAGLSGCGSNATSEAAATFWERDCSGCHRKETSSTSSSSPAVDGYLSAFHVTNGAFTAVSGTKGGQVCQPCHGAYGEELEALHASASGEVPIRLQETDVTEATCLACHGTYDSLAQATAESTVLTDSGGGTTGTPIVVNPHTAPSLAPTHSGAGMNCRSCHGSHRAKTALALCKSCHHATVWECNTCHH